MPTISPQDITQLLADWGKGDKSALEKLLPLVHSELRQIARRQMSQERPGHTLQATALINEAYLKLLDQEGFEWHNRAHFFAVCAQIMRHILIDHARAHARDKRGGGAIKVSLNDADAAVIAGEKAEQLIALEDSLRFLELVDPQKGRIVELRYFGGLSIDETAEALNISPRTVRREWQRSKAWLYRVLYRYGLLALISAIFFLHLMVFFPITSDFSAWYATDFVLALFICIALAVFGFYTSLAGQPLFRGALPDD